MQVDIGSRNQSTMSGRTSRFVPFLIALTICATSAVALGFGAWHFFGKNPTTVSNKTPKVISDAAVQAATAGGPEAAPANGNTPKEPATAPNTGATAPPPGTLYVTGAMLELGGSDPTVPAQRVSVDSFFISETEVTNQQYQDFVKQTGHRGPAGWKDGEYPLGAANEPVTGVSWQDAVEYCEWLSSKLGETVRLPAEAEWELAARGPQGLKFPWGNEWDDRAAASEKKQGFVHAVKSYPVGRSPCGAYDMAGNVWEWVGDVREPAEKTATPENTRNRVIKGGAANEQPELITGTSRNLVPKDYAGSFVGFRYVVVRS